MRADDIFKGLKKDENGKFVKPENPWFGKKKQKEQTKPLQFTKIEQTINVHASKMMPKDERLNFVDPKTVELPIKLVPRLKVTIEAMGSSVKKPMRPWLVYGIVGIIAALAISIVYSQIIQPQQEAEYKFQLDLQKQCAAQNSTNCIVPNVSPNGANGVGGNGGGLFNFKLINPLQPPGSGVTK